MYTNSWVFDVSYQFDVLVSIWFSGVACTLSVSW